MDVQAVAGPSSRPYGPSTDAAVPSAYANGTANGVTSAQNGRHDISMTEPEAMHEAPRVKKTSAVFNTSDGILSKAINKKPRTGA